MWDHAGYVETWPPLGSVSRERYLAEAERAMSGPAPSTESKLSEIGELLSRRAKLVELGNRARMLRQRSRASLIDQTLRQVTHDLMRLGG